MNTEKYFNGAEEWDRWTLLSKTFFIIEGRKKIEKKDNLAVRVKIQPRRKPNEDWIGNPPAAAWAKEKWQK